ncbi:MAG: methyltransferase domain-containing protein [Defluviitaleaceae bacterium]|nr:methyltransferase domain-containing protein [Defluviitaleaceae bacterium]
MNNVRWSKPPQYEKNGTPYFGSDREGDQFDEADIASWTTGGRFARRWQTRGATGDYNNAVYHALCQKAADTHLPLMEIACGPNLGLLPDILAIRPDAQVLATDACPAVIENWQAFMQTNAPEALIQFACFNAANMPLPSNTIDAITSNIGLSSLRYAGDDQANGISEAYRVLKPGGHLFTIENEHENKAIVQEVFDRWGKKNWFRNDKLTWDERFTRAGFIIEEKTPHYRRVESTDWELGEAAASFGLEIVITSYAYILRKP